MEMYILWRNLHTSQLTIILKPFMFMFGVPVCKGSGSRTAWVCVSVWKHGPASSTWHRNLWQQQSRVWLHHRPCVLQLETHWMISVHPVWLTLNTSNKEKKTEHWRSMWHLRLVVKEILYKVLSIPVLPDIWTISFVCLQGLLAL